MARTLAVLFDDLGLAPDPARMAEAERLLTGAPLSCSRPGWSGGPARSRRCAPCRRPGWPAALVTNTGRALTELALDGIGREHFAVTVCGDEVPLGKPDPDPYLRAAELLGVAAARLPGGGGLADRGAGRRAGRRRACSWCPARSRCPAARAGSCGNRWSG